MDHVSRLYSTALVMTALTGCGFVKEPYTQLQLARAKSSSFPEAGSRNFLCARIRNGAKTKSVIKEEFRLGIDVCYAKLPTTTSAREYNLEFSNYLRKEVEVSGTSERWGVMISLPLEYKMGVAKANLPTSVPSKIGLRVPGAKDVDLSFWYALGYNFNLTPKKTDYATTIGTFDNIPGVEVNGNFYGELGQELVLFGRFPLGTSLRADTKGKVTPFFSAGLRVPW